MKAKIVFTLFLVLALSMNPSFARDPEFSDELTVGGTIVGHNPILGPLLVPVEDAIISPGSERQFNAEIVNLEDCASGREDSQGNPVCFFTSRNTELRVLTFRKFAGLIGSCSEFNPIPEGSGLFYSFEQGLAREACVVGNSLKNLGQASFGLELYDFYVAPSDVNGNAPLESRVFGVDTCSVEDWLVGFLTGDAPFCWGAGMTEEVGVLAPKNCETGYESTCANFPNSKDIEFWVRASDESKTTKFFDYNYCNENSIYDFSSNDPALPEYLERCPGDHDVVLIVDRGDSDTQDDLATGVFKVRVVDPRVGILLSVLRIAFVAGAGAAGIIRGRKNK